MPLVSVIMPVYKTGKYLDAAVESVLAQSLADWELILVDDGSPDECGAMCDAWAEKDKRITALHKQNGGQGSARNLGICSAAGEYIGFIDSDDVLHTEFLSELVGLLQTGGLDFARCGFARFFDDDIHRFREDNNPSLVLPNGDAIKKKLLMPLIGSYKASRAVVPTACTTLYRSGIIQKHNLRFRNEREYQSEDLLFNMDFLAHAQKGACIPSVLYYYRDAAESFSNAYCPEMFTRIVHLRGYLLEWGEHNGFAANEEFTARVNSRLLDQASVVIKKAVQFLPKTEARAEIERIARDGDIRAALEGCDTAALGFPLSLFCSLLRKRQTGALWWLIKLYTKTARAK